MSNKNIMSFREYRDFLFEANKDKYRNHVSYYDPTEGWVLNLKRKYDVSKIKQT